MISNIKWHCLLLCFVNIKHGASSNPITLRILQLEYDVLEYVVIEHLAQGEREKMKDDSLSFFRLATITGIILGSFVCYQTCTILLLNLQDGLSRLLFSFVFVSYL